MTEATRTILHVSVRIDAINPAYTRLRIFQGMASTDTPIGFLHTLTRANSGAMVISTNSTAHFIARLQPVQIRVRLPDDQAIAPDTDTFITEGMTSFEIRSIVDRIIQRNT